jgi:hypothetical protein
VSRSWRRPPVSPPRPGRRRPACARPVPSPRPAHPAPVRRSPPRRAVRPAPPGQRPPRPAPGSAPPGWPAASRCSSGTCRSTSHG